MAYDNRVTDDDLNAIKTAMADYVAPFTSPISRVIDDYSGILEGSGTFLNLNDATYIITNEHVARARLSHRLAHTLGNNRKVAAIVHPFRCLTFPTDVAIARIDDFVIAESDKQSVSADSISRHYTASDGEVMFIRGYPGKGSYFSGMLSTLFLKPLSFASDFVPPPAGYRPDWFFSLNYPAQPVKDQHGNPIDLPDPRGLSGTLVWNTRFVETYGAKWSPADARVEGIVAKWNQTDQTLIAVKIEWVRNMLVEALRQEAAYFRWHERGRPEDDDWSDWDWAVKSITDIA